MKSDSGDTTERIAARKRVQEAIALCESAGQDAALAEIANPAGRFVCGDRCVFALDTGGTLLAHPLESRLTGNLLIDLKDCDGRAFIRKIVDICKGRGYGYVDYKLHDPGTGKVVRKTLFFERLNGIILCSGFHGPEEPLL